MKKPLMKPVIKKIEQGQFGKAVEQALANKGMIASSFAEELGVSYEHARRLLNSSAYPSRALFEKICRILSLNPVQAREMLIADKLRHKFGDVHLKLAGRDPKLYDLEQMIAELPPSQLHLLRGIVRGMLDAKRRG